MNSFARIILLLLILASLLFPFLTWVLAAFEFPVRSLFSDEGLRWLFYNGSASLVSYPIELFVLFLVSWGALCFVGYFNHPWKNCTAWCASLLLLIFLLLLMAFAAFSVHSPLISITGTIGNSPLLYGLPAAICVVFLIISFLYGLLSAKLKAQSDFVSFFTYGISHYAPWLLSGMLLSFIVSCLRFAFRI